MAKIEISEDKRHFVKSGEKFFWLGDTIWSAFTNISMEEWKEYLNIRKEEGFNILQINTLPQWDRCRPDLGLYPFEYDKKGFLDPKTLLNEKYYENAAEMCDMAVKMGFTLALVVVWCNIVPDSWITRFMPGQKAWALEDAFAHIERVVKYFGRFDPVYIISGDTDFKKRKTIDYYLKVSEKLKELSPDSLKTYHIMGKTTYIPEELEPYEDFVIYQSGHSRDQSEFVESMPRYLREKYPDKPLLNAEPCYEAMRKAAPGLFSKKINRFSEDEVLSTMKRSILAGADAGITYGANGVWNYNRGESTGKFSPLIDYGKPLLYKEAVMLPAATKVHMLKELVK